MLKKISTAIALAAVAVVGWSWYVKGQVVGPPNNILCSSSANLAFGTTGTYVLVTGVQGRLIYVCGWFVTNNSATGATFSIYTGSGVNCSTMEKLVNTPHYVTQTSPATTHIDYAFFNSTSPGDSMCIDVQNNLAATVWYGQY
jgi:hypothetical protein